MHTIISKRYGCFLRGTFLLLAGLCFLVFYSLTFILDYPAKNPKNVHPFVGHKEIATAATNNPDHGPNPGHHAHNNAPSHSSQTTAKKEKNIRCHSCTPSKSHQWGSFKSGRWPNVVFRRPNRRNHLRLRIRKITRHKIIVRGEPLVPISQKKRQTHPHGGKWKPRKHQRGVQVCHVLCDGSTKCE